MNESTEVGFLRENRHDLPVTRLSPCFEATPIGLVVSGTPSIDEWIETGEKLRAVERGIQWCLGDWLAYGEGHYGDDALEAEDYTYGGLANLKYVSSRINFSRRRELSWSHHQEVAALEPEEQDAWLEVAEQNEWSRATLRQAIKESKDSQYPVWLKYTDVWNIASCDERFGIDFPGRIPGQIIQNLLYYYTSPGDLVIDPMAGGGTTLDVCKHEGRRCFAFDIQPARVDIDYMDATKPWGLQEAATLIFIDPPYWSQREGDYGGMAGYPYPDYLRDMTAIIGQAHANLKAGGDLAILIAPMAIKTEYIDIPYDLINICLSLGFSFIRRISVPVGSQQVGPQIQEACKKAKRMVALLRDLLIFERQE